MCGLSVSYIALESNFQTEAFLTYVCGPTKRSSCLTQPCFFRFPFLLCFLLVWCLVCLPLLSAPYDLLYQAILCASYELSVYTCTYFSLLLSSVSFSVLRLSLSLCLPFSLVPSPQRRPGLQLNGSVGKLCSNLILLHQSHPTYYSTCPSI